MSLVLSSRAECIWRNCIPYWQSLKQHSNSPSRADLLKQCAYDVPAIKDMATEMFTCSCMAKHVITSGSLLREQLSGEKSSAGQAGARLVVDGRDVLVLLCALLARFLARAPEVVRVDAHAGDVRDVLQLRARARPVFSTLWLARTVPGRPGLQACCYVGSASTCCSCARTHAQCSVLHDWRALYQDGQGCRLAAMWAAPDEAAAQTQGLQHSGA